MGFHKVLCNSISLKLYVRHFPLLFHIQICSRNRKFSRSYAPGVGEVSHIVDLRGSLELWWWGRPLTDLNSWGYFCALEDSLSSFVSSLVSLWPVNSKLLYFLLHSFFFLSFFLFFFFFFLEPRNTGSKLCLQPTQWVMAGSLTHWVRLGMEPATS